MTNEEKKLQDARESKKTWRKWGPYLSDRQWGTVREDYSPNGNAWEFFPHDHARSRTYRWGEDGLAGISDDKAQLCFSIALWNGNDPILKERLFGLTNSEGNHGEDVKEYYFHLDNTPTHSYMKMLYKYPHAAFPYDDLIQENNRRKSNPQLSEYELLDTGIFNDKQYTDVFVEYAKNEPEDIFIRISLINRGNKSQDIWLLPTVWFRNTWSWGRDQNRPKLSAISQGDVQVIEASHAILGTRYLYCDAATEMLFVENETNLERFQWGPNSTPYPKDGINDYVLSEKTAERKRTVNRDNVGTKASPLYKRTLEAGETVVVQLRLTTKDSLGEKWSTDLEAVFSREIQNADEFYKKIAAPGMPPAEEAIQRQAFAGMLWSKQYFYYVVQQWLDGDPAGPKPPAKRHFGRNSRWTHFFSEDILSMPDKWEYPWFAGWDSGFQSIVWAMIDPDYAKNQLLLLSKEWYMHPEGQIPAYEWSFDDVNPPVQSWAAWRVYKIEKKMYGRADITFLSQIYQRSLLYLTWWLNRKDQYGNNLFQGGFLGLDNIGLFDRNQAPAGTSLSEADASSWMGLFTLTMMQIGIELAKSDSNYDSMSGKFLQHFALMANSLNHPQTGGIPGLYDEEDGFYYDTLRLNNGEFISLKVRSLQGLTPLFAVETVSIDTAQYNADFGDRLLWFVKQYPELLAQITPMKAQGGSEEATTQGNIESGPGGHYLFSFVNKDRLKSLLRYMLDENEFLGPHGIRSVSKFHDQHPVTCPIDGKAYDLQYAPGESITSAFGGNSNWRGPVWYPLNFILIESLQKYHHYYQDSLKVECPTGSGHFMNLWDVSMEISKRLISGFTVDHNNRRPVYGDKAIFQTDPHWKDCILFFEYFHGDNGTGLGASHQTGWTGLLAKLIQQKAGHISTMK